MSFIQNLPSNITQTNNALKNLQELTLLKLQDLSTSMNNFDNGLDARSISGMRTQAGVFLFDCPLRTAVKISNRSTDHYTENNSIIQDHIVKNPIRITLTGLVAEVVMKAPTGWQKLLNDIKTNLS